MRKFLIARSSLAAVAAAGSAGAVDVTLGGSIDMGVDFGLGKEAGEMAISDVHNTVSLSIAAAGTTDGGLKYGGSFGIGTAAELSFTPYEDGDEKYAIKATNGSHTDIEAAVYNVSGGGAIDAADVVAVKINSEWKSVGGTATNYEEPLGAFSSSQLCKLAGIGTKDDEASIYRGALSTYSPDQGSDADFDGGYLAAGMAIGTDGDTDASFGITNGWSAETIGSATPDADEGIKWKVWNDADETVATSAIVYVGPFMEVQLASSSTKMVVGGVCLEGMVASDTMIHMNNASKVLTAGAASIYIEGGFGKLTLQSGDYSGAVSAIGGAGNAAGIDADGLVVVASGIGMLGANPYLAMDLAPGATLGAVELVAGGSITFAGLSGAMDIELADGGLASAIGTDIAAWDLGLNYQMGDMALAFATDSDNDWGLSASMAVAGFGVNAVFSSEGTGDHEKSGIMYSVTASTALNGFGLSIGVDQDLEPTVGLSYDLGAMNVYAGYDASEGGGTAGVKLSF